MYIHTDIYKHDGYIYTGIYKHDGLFLGFYFVPLVYRSIFMSVSYRFNYYGFVVLLEIRKCDAFSFVLLSWDCLGSVESFMTVQILGFFFYFSEENKTRLITRMTIDAKIFYQMLAKWSQQFINKVNTTTKFPGTQECFNIGKSVNVFHHISRIK